MVVGAIVMASALGTVSVSCNRLITLKLRCTVVAMLSLKFVLATSAVLVNRPLWAGAAQVNVIGLVAPASI